MIRLFEVLLGTTDKIITKNKKIIGIHLIVYLKQVTGIVFYEMFTYQFAY